MSISSISPRSADKAAKSSKAREPRPVPDNAVAVRLPQMCQMLSIGPTKAAELIRTGAVESRKLGKTRLISVRSIMALAQSDEA